MKSNIYKGRQSCALLIAAIILLAGCTNGRNSEPKPAESEYAMAIREVDSMRFIRGGDKYADEPATLAAWRDFADLYCNEKFSEAYEFLKKDDNFERIFVYYLRNTTAQYKFVKLWDKCMMEHSSTKEEYVSEAKDAYLFCLALTRMVVEVGGDDPYVPQHYEDLITDCARFILEDEDWDTAEKFDEEFYFAYKAITGDEWFAQCMAMTFRCFHLCKKGRKDLAEMEIAAFRKEIQLNCPKEQKAKMLEMTDKLENSINEDK